MRVREIVVIEKPGMNPEITQNYTYPAALEIQKLLEGTRWCVETQTWPNGDVRVFLCKNNVIMHQVDYEPSMHVAFLKMLRWLRANPIKRHEI